MGEAFMGYNSDGLLIESFVRYGTKLWLAAERRLICGGTQGQIPGLETAISCGLQNLAAMMMIASFV